MKLICVLDNPYRGIVKSLYKYEFEQTFSVEDFPNMVISLDALPKNYYIRNWTITNDDDGYARARTEIFDKIETLKSTSGRILYQTMQRLSVLRFYTTP